MSVLAKESSGERPSLVGVFVVVFALLFLPRDPRRPLWLLAAPSFCSRSGGSPAGLLRVEEAVRLGQRGHQFEVQQGLAGIHRTPAVKRRARIIGQPGQEHVHALDLGLLAVGDLIRELEQDRIVGRARLFEQLLDHLHRALVVGDHQLEE